MSFSLPAYTAPDFYSEPLRSAPDVSFAECPADGVLPEGFHSTSMFPEYCRIGGSWRLAPESRMDSQIVLRQDGSLDVVEMRNVKKGDMVALGRTEDGSCGIYVHSDGFGQSGHDSGDRFLFRQNRSRETSFSKDYDSLAELLKYERDHGNILWVMGPAFSFDSDSRDAMSAIIDAGYAHGLMAGNALATHDLEGALLHTALGQDIYTGENVPNGHYNHMDVINLVRRSGSIPAFIEEHGLKDGIIYSAVRNHVPIVLAGSIRDDGPLPEVITDSARAADAMRGFIKKSTTVICLATMLHTIATGNMTPSFRVLGDGTVRPVYFYCVDSSEFVLNKLIDRGSLSATTILSNVHDFIVRLAGDLGVI
ncbi:MAG: hypothetical protein ACOX6J_04335 [Oscillospiraceae bacterium]|jgi:lysine-ketoglutarate reductase/saccharopine dehydrogenase-like protein (TIGR00300 family)